jgi:beta-glucosidase
MKFGMDVPESEKLKQAVELAEKSDVAIIFAGLTNTIEGEGVDKETLELPAGQDNLIQEITKVNKNTIVVLINGTPVNMERWIDKVPTIIEAWYPGQEGGNAIANILFGDVNPSGKLPVTFPKKLSDNPSYGNYPGSEGKVHYKEGIFVGYRHYDKNNIEPRFPFGHGLSYSKFEYSNLIISPKQTKGGDVTVRLDIKNISNREGAEVVQLYINDKQSSLERPLKELKAFEKVTLKPAEKKKGWVAEPGEFEILIGSSSSDIRLKDTLTLTD